MIESELKAVTQENLKRLIEDPVREGKTIEYKSELAISTDDQKRKFLASVASFANASGGDIVFGMIADDGKPVALKPLTSFNPDRDTLRLRDLIRAHIQPKVFGFDFRAVELSGGGWALVLRIPKKLGRRPHAHV
jgi:predicted HTH transcriptional regulator